MKLLNTVLRSVQTAHRWVRILEPWGILLAVCGFAFTLWAFQVDRADREEDRINRAIRQFADGIGRIDALRVLLRNDVDLRALRAEEAFLPGADLSRADLSDAHLPEANLSDANLSWADLSRADLSGADLLRTDLSNAYLSKADLSDTDLSWANFSNAILSDADISGADLSGVNFSGANLSGANLSGATAMKMAKGTTSFQRGIVFCSTTVPDGSLCNQDCDGGNLSCPWLEALEGPGPGRGAAALNP